MQRNDHSGQYSGNMTILGNDASDSTSEHERYDDVNAMCRNGIDVSQPGTSGGNKGEDLVMVDYSVAQNSDNLMRLKRNKDHDLPVVASNSSQKVVNISANADMWKPPNYQEPRKVAGVDGWKPVQEGEGASKSGTRIVRDNNNHLAANGNVRHAHVTYF